jgi:RNA polymerase sigma factor (sigma-70 family)
MVPVLGSGIMAGSDNATLLAAAADGDQVAWTRIVDRYAGLVWSVARGFRLGQADAADVAQATWLRLVEHLRTIRDSDHLGAWLATTARREALALLRHAGRDVPTGDPLDFDAWDDRAEPLELGLLTAERDAQLWQAFRTLPGRCQRLLRVLLAEPAPSYVEVGEALGIPVGSIGPTRARCLAALRHRLGPVPG